MRMTLKTQWLSEVAAEMRFGSSFVSSNLVLIIRPMAHQERCGEIATTELRSDPFIPLLCKRSDPILCSSYLHSKIDLNRQPKPLILLRNRELPSPRVLALCKKETNLPSSSSMQKVHSPDPFKSHIPVI